MAKKILSQFSKPKGFLGRLIARNMNTGHHKMTNWGLDLINIKNPKKILDIGCGGGRTIKKLSISFPDSTVYGIDYSKESIYVSKRVNKKNVKDGRVILKEANVSSMPFENDDFDLITAIESYYFWPDIENDMKEVLRVLKPNCMFLIISSAYKNDKFDKRNKYFVKRLNMHYFSTEELYSLLSNTGFKNIKINEKFEKGWLSAISEK